MSSERRCYDDVEVHPVTRRISPDDIQRRIEALDRIINRGESVPVAARAVGRSRRVVFRWLEELRRGEGVPAGPLAEALRRELDEQKNAVARAKLFASLTALTLAEGRRVLEDVRRGRVAEAAPRARSGGDPFRGTDPGWVREAAARGLDLLRQVRDVQEDGDPDLDDLEHEDVQSDFDGDAPE